MTGPAEDGSAQVPESTAPFPGLRPFSFEDHQFFFGREDQTFALCGLLLRNHFVAVIGSSGSGKSSIVRAGLLPQLHAENDRSGKDSWQWLTMRPGRDPMGHLAEALAGAAGSESDALFEARRRRIEATLRSSSRGIAEAISHTSIADTAQIVLVVDQFEELFRYLVGSRQLDRMEAMRRRDETTEFVQLLLTATQRHDSRIRVVITMRSDFIGDCALFQGLPEAVSATQFLVPSLSKDQRREAIREPIRLAGGTIDPELVETLVEDSGNESDQLPVLQHCLARLWTRAGSPDAGSEPGKPEDASAHVRRLTVDGYREIGGLAGALSGHAEEIIATLPGYEKTAEQIFRALGEIDKDGRAIRRTRPLAQLIDETFIEGEVSRQSVCAVLDRFRADDCSFIVPPVATALSDDVVIDVGHEALLRRWTRVCGDPEATGERADKREIGWLRQEQKDGEYYQFLRSCVDPESSNDSELPANQAERYWNWWKNRKPSPAWAARYGGRFTEVERLVKGSYATTLQSRRKKFAGYAGVAIVAGLFVIGGLYLIEQQKFSSDNFRLTVTSAEKFSRAILENFNAGRVTSSGALALNDVAAGLYRGATELKQTSETRALQTSWLLTASDIDDALGKGELVRATARDAENDARKYLAQEPNNLQWQKLLYGSLFRLGDIDLSQSIDEHDPVAMQRAVAEYDESQRIATGLLAAGVTGLTATPRPDKAELASAADPLAEQKFYLAFATNKVGEAMQVKGNIEAALVKYNEALVLATAIENTARIEWKLQSATTKIKIADALMASEPPKIDEALKYYSAAVAREQAIFAEDNSNNIVRSNLAAAYEGRARAFERNKDFDATFKGYSDASAIFGRLVEENPLDTKWLERLARVQRKSGAALESYARSRNEPLDAAVRQYQAEVATRTKLAERGPQNVGWQNALRDSQQRLQNASAAQPPGNK